MSKWSQKISAYDIQVGDWIKPLELSKPHPIHGSFFYQVISVYDHPQDGVIFKISSNPLAFPEGDIVLRRADVIYHRCEIVRDKRTDIEDPRTSLEREYKIKFWDGDDQGTYVEEAFFGAGNMREAFEWADYKYGDFFEIKEVGIFVGDREK